MKDQQLVQTVRRLRQARRPEDVFAAATTADILKRRYRQLLLLVHPDQNRGAEVEAREAFELLQTWYAQARRKMADGTYGTRTSIRVLSPEHIYEGCGDPLPGDLCDLYPVRIAGDPAPVLVKTVRSARNNDLMQAEATALRRLDRALANDPLRAHFPTLLESFQVEDGSGQRRQANALRRETETVALAEVIAAYPEGIDPADAAWMFNRLLAALAIAHSQGIVHGATVPPHLLLCLCDHNGILIDWCYSVEIGTPVRAISPPYRHYAPPEVLAKRPATAATDLYMAAQCMVDLLGGDVTSGTLPPSVPPPIVALLRACLIPNPARRPQDAWTVFEDFGEIVTRLYGPPQFRPFAMPDRG